MITTASDDTLTPWPRNRFLQGLTALQELLLLSEPDPLWGERLVALVRPAFEPADAGIKVYLLDSLALLARNLPPSQRPRRWLFCHSLERNALGKWERQRWTPLAGES